MSDVDKVFGGSIPDVYDDYLVPLIFETFAADLARRVVSSEPMDVLETAVGSGVVTRALAPLLSDDARFTVTNLAAADIERQFGSGPVSGKIQAHVFVSAR